MTLLKKGLLLIAVPLLFQLVFIFLMNRSLSDAAEAEKMALHTKDVLVQAQTAYSDIVMAQSAARGYIITSNPTFGTEAEGLLDTALNTFKGLSKLVSDNPVQTSRAKAVLGSAQSLDTWIRQMMVLVRAARRDQAVSQVIAFEGKSRMDRLRAELDEFIREEGRLEAQRLGALHAARTSQRWMIGGGVFGATLVTCFVAYVFSRGVSRRVSVVTANAEALAEGQPLAGRLPGGDEIARLDAVMHETARRLSEGVEAERRYKAELEKRATELSAANESLRQQTQENEMFVYSVSHDLRSPLVNLQGFSQELAHAGADLRSTLSDDRVPPDIRKRVDRLLEADVVDSIRFIQSAVTRSASIIDALLRLSRAGRVEYRLQTVDVQSTVARVVDAMANTIEGKSARVVVGDLPPCRGDPAAVEQIFGNLIGNAVNYLDPARPGVVEVGTAGESGVLRHGKMTYYVRDNGLGIPAAYLGKVFVAFQRLHGDIAKGEGIGLALVRRAVERHGGEIWVESTEGVGTTFYLALPPDAGSEAPLPVAAAAEHSETPRV
ncbi:sensor histidine kinase [Humisphaera borealis]|uniref:histidine kinase n=1 Tax=Humisphaera borealis TaxID=2807512 RepID=A0A7M2WX77_9BACT|nr:sensor histidine kinase [Humisphaera borealis]QOV90095.1 CHASE3 domain-containing protein [Humisphaera borealis]